MVHTLLSLRDTQNGTKLITGVVDYTHFVGNHGWSRVFFTTCHSIIFCRQRIELTAGVIKIVDGFIRCDFNQLFIVLANLLRQSRGSSLVLLLMTLYGLVVVSQYEFYMTSDLVVKYEYQPFKRLDEFLDNGYKIKLYPGYWNDWINALVSKRKGKNTTANDIFIFPNGQTQDQVIYSFKKEDPFIGVPTVSSRYLGRSIVPNIFHGNL